MKIALLSDIHANLPAMQAALESIDAQKPDAIYCLGDLVGYNVWPNEVIQLIQQRKIATLAGNHDLKVKTLKQQEAGNKTAKNYAYSLVGLEERNYLLSLPAHIRLSFQLNDHALNLLFVHGSPRKVDEYILQDMDEHLLAEMMQQAGADLLCFGHSHKPYHRIINTGIAPQNHFRHAINIGSVGKPKDLDPRGCYVLLTINENSSILEAESLGVEFIRFHYDIEKAAKAIEESPLPNELADMLRKGY